MKELLIVAMSALSAFYASMHPGAVSATLGVPGVGKTPIVVQAWREGALRDRVVVVDPYARRDRLEFSTGRSTKRPWPGMLISPQQLLANLEVLDRPKLMLVVCPEGVPAEKALGDIFSAVARACWHSGSIDLVGEEFGKYGRQASEWVNTVASGGGHADMRLHAICQSLGRVQIDGRRNITHLVVGAQGDEEDLRVLRLRCGKVFAAAVKKLRPREDDRPADPPLTWRLGGATSLGLPPAQETTT